MKLPQLTFTRFVAAVGVVFLHYGAPIVGKSIPELGKSFIYLNSLVSYFFILSGFILVVSSTTKSGQPTDRQFWLNRFARIYPLYLLAFLLTALLVAIIGDEQFLYVESAFAKPALASALLVQAWIPDYAFYLNYPGWSLSVEALFYALFPFLFRVLRSVSTLSLVVLSVGSWLLNQAFHIYLKVHGATAAFTNAFPPFHFTTFLMGVCLGIGFVRYGSVIHFRKHFINISLFAIMTVAAYLIVVQSVVVRNFEAGLFAPIFAVAILYLCVNTNRLVRLFTKPNYVYFGEISYGVYILQAPVAILVRYVNKTYLYWNAAISFLLFLVLLLIVATLCYELIEKPCRAWLRHLSVDQST